jgi:ATP-dependent RNA helicase DDX10/DBP4
MVKEQAIPLAGPSRHQNAKKTKKNAKPAIRTSKLKKLTEKQKIDALEKDVMDFVSILAKLHCISMEG